MQRLQIIYAASFAFWADTIYLRYWSALEVLPQHSSSYVQAALRDPSALALSVPEILWLVCTVGLSFRHKWAYYGCFLPHILLIFYGAVSVAVALFGPKAQDARSLFFLWLTVAQFFLGSGSCLYWLVTERTKLLTTPTPSA